MNLNELVKSSIQGFVPSEEDKEPLSFYIDTNGIRQSQVLYKQNTTGKIQRWRVWIVGNTVHTEYGQEGGQLMQTHDVIRGKNKGKVNETSDQHQAILKADQMYDKKVKEGYVPSIEQASSSRNNLAGVAPMLAFPIKDKWEHVKFPAIVQPKLDGMRCIAVIENGHVTLFSRTQKRIDTVPHINEQLSQLFVGTDIILDGELYNHDLRDDFNRIMSLIKRDQTHPEAHLYIQYHVYDVVYEDLSWTDRTVGVYDVIDMYASSVVGIKTVPFTEVTDDVQLKEAVDLYVGEGFEGGMYRHPSKGYEYKRSTSLLKIKTMLDDEFEIVGVVEGNGKLRGKAGSFILQTWDGQEFKAKLKGELDALEEYFVNFPEYKGKMLTVQYQNLTPDGIPRFPVGIRIRMEE
jgi:DNA ligase-1